jgi:ATP-dependent Clp protease ATP-binding subunit ClpX
MKEAPRPPEKPRRAGLPELRTLTPREVFEHLRRFVVGQEKALRAVSVAAYHHVQRIRAAREKLPVPVRKSNVLLIGPTGCGKTHIARNLAAVLDVPFTVADATEYTEAGYYGKDVEVMIGELLFQAGLDVERTQAGIVFVDEVDKISRRTHGARTGAGSRDIGGEGVQQAMLKLLEGREIFVPLNVTQHWSKHDFVLVDTTHILFLCAGTFTDLWDYSAGGRLGFGARERKGRARKPTQRELQEYGMIAEFLSRIPVVVQLDALTEDEMLRVLTEPEDSLVREYQTLLSLDDVRLEFEAEALRAIARRAHGRGLGARSLRAIFEEMLHDELFRAPEMRGQTLTVTRDMVEERLAG